MYCKNCGKEIPDGTEYCESCRPKKQIYKRWWFWAIVAVVFLMAIIPNGVSQSDYDALVLKNAELEELVSAHLETMDELQDSVADLEESLSAAETERDTALSDLAAASGIISGLQEQVEDLQSALADAETSVSQSTTTTGGTGSSDGSTGGSAGTLVWIPNSGSKYHSTSTCSNMKNPTQVSLETALARGFGKCSKCW